MRSLKPPTRLMPLTNAHHKRQELGVALVIVMMFIVILSGIAAFSANRAISGEGMSRNQLDVEVARQAAEAAIRDAELDMRIRNSNLKTGALCARAVGSRPLKATSTGTSPFGEVHFTASCLLGQCNLSTTGTPAEYAAFANAAANINPQPWWPSANLWNNTFTDKPPTNTSCSFNGGVPLGTFSGANALRGVIRQPEYMIEYLKRGEQNYFRVTARGWGLTNNSEIIMQSFFTLEQ
jgi:type IV pilus assembly protein PilX